MSWILAMTLENYTDIREDDRGEDTKGTSSAPLHAGKWSRPNSTLVVHILDWTERDFKAGGGALYHSEDLFCPLLQVETEHTKPNHANVATLMLFQER